MYNAAAKHKGDQEGGRETGEHFHGEMRSLACTIKREL
jgi:hypothetical protein